MPNPQNLRTPTSEEAREMQRKGARARRRNFEKKHLLIEVIRDVMCGKMEVPDNLRNLGTYMGRKFGKTAIFGEVALTALFAKAVQRGDSRAFLELAKFAGMSYDQSAEGLGGENNPINVAQTTTISPERIKFINNMLENEC